MTTLKVAMIGHGFMGAAHSQGWRTAHRVFNLPARPQMAVLVGRNGPAVAANAEKWGWEASATDWREVIARDDIDIIDIVTPGASHAEIAIAALKAGKHVLCEKPLANTVQEAGAMAAAAAEASRRGVVSMVGFTYRRVPAASFMRQLISQGVLGQIRQVRASYRQDWLVDPTVPLTWRLQQDQAGSGALGDIGAHAIDLVHFATGLETREVSGVLQTINTQRALPDGSGFGQVSVDDLALFTGRLSNGALASFEASRFATGRKNALSIEISGDKGALAFDLEDLNSLHYYDRTDPEDRQGFRKILVTEASHPYVSGWWPAGHMLGYEHGFSHQVKDLVEGIHNGTQPHSSFAEGLQVQRVLDAVTRSAAQESIWTRVEHDAQIHAG
ncbi:Gfo/Idh/MocA family oxidoreductase [Glutamicibacter sp. MNS18]|uniref:Gfo/Idh/MocA family protein n=1 Tax=Glutamicibacter sp. MNS18 TaxID=2989817 RepID=UPI0022359035|nr:Gfo/Idh/MocA family oxidoreductase [Glutamicibacter sp. MNS18]MCW4466292.1 Gfo/Idh/MocA family oxidoreductase [Glutamicibacter sp. MNS18]